MMYDEQNLLDPGTLRLRAVERLKGMKKTDTHRLEMDPEQLMREIHLLRIEMELQKEELIAAYETAEIALQKYTLFYELAPLGYFILDTNANICELNFTGAELLDDRRMSLVKRDFRSFITPGSIGVFNKFYSKIYSTNTNQTCEVNLAHQGAHECKVYMDGILTDDKKCLLTVIDISESKTLTQG
jgi:hypothetical protein